MDITTNLQIETRRLDSLGVRFRMYEHSGNQKVGIIVRATDATPENESKILNAGYEASIVVKKGDAKLYEISVEKLEKVNEHIISLVELETLRIKTIDGIIFRYKFSNDNKFVINVLENGTDENIPKMLTEMGYSSRNWTTQKNVSEYSIPISELEKIHQISEVDSSN